MVVVVGALGKGIGSESPLARVIEHSDADIAYVVVTKDSLPRIKDLAAQLGTRYQSINIIPVLLPDPDNPIETYRNLEKIPSPPDVVDITAGTKAIAAALFYYAAKHGCKVAYVTGMRDPETGRVISGTEQVKIYETTGMDE